jgi:peptidoglycan/LPS O-acetylase OafA/YrhL
MFLVFLSHTQLNGWVSGGFGVTVFFFLSGYLITTLLRREAESSGHINLKNFYIRRSLRIFPPMYVALAMGLVLTGMGLLPNTITWAGVSAQAFYYTNYYMVFGPQDMRGTIAGLDSLWSLAVEEHFYLLFPFVYLLVRQHFPRPKDQFLALGAIWLAISAWRCALVWGWHVYYQRASLATDTRLDSILIGCMLAVYENPFLDRSRWSDCVWKRLLVLALIVLLVSFFLPGVALRESIRYSMQNWALIPVFVCAIRFPMWGLFRILNIGWIKLIGVLSYSLYLVHGSIMHACSHLTMPRPLQDCAALALSFGAALLIYVLIERPSAQLRKWLL